MKESCVKRLAALERADQNNLLWSPIADAVETFLRRRGYGFGSYERIWRLIHIWEALEITLSAGVLAKYSLLPADDSRLRKCREYFYGVSWDQVTTAMTNTLGAAQGSMDQWINILDEASKDAESDSDYLEALRKFLLTESITFTQLGQAWRRSCDAPPDALSETPVTVRQAMRHVNTFRNRLAHVPFPHDPLEDLACAFEDVTDQLFSVEPAPWRHATNEGSSPLTGALMFRGHKLHGTAAEAVDYEATDTPHFVFPCPLRSGGLESFEQWQTGPLVHIDSMLRPHVLTRIKDEQGTGEYIRFKAEANAVLNRYDIGIHETFPIPKAAEYDIREAEGEADTGEPRRAESFADAIDAIRGERFDEAIAFFEELTQKRPSYHIGWLRLGHARREKAVRLPKDDDAQAIALLTRAVKDLTQAAKHRDPDYQAQALYERSKAHFHLARRGSERPANYADALKDAEAAESIYPGWKFESWLEYLENSPYGCLAEAEDLQDPDVNLTDP